MAKNAQSKKMKPHMMYSKTGKGQMVYKMKLIIVGCLFILGCATTASPAIAETDIGDYNLKGTCQNDVSRNSK